MAVRSQDLSGSPLLNIVRQKGEREREKIGYKIKGGISKGGKIVEKRVGEQMARMSAKRSATLCWGPKRELHGCDALSLSLFSNHS